LTRRQDEKDEKSNLDTTLNKKRRDTMKTQKAMLRFVCAVVLLSGLWFIIPGMAAAHCDTMDGPVVATARAALDKGEVTSVLKWVRKEDEDEIREQFKKTLAVRSKGKEAKELADMYFYETLVRIHRTGEGAPYTGLKQEPVEPVVATADKALETGSADALMKLVSDAVAAGIRERFAHAKETKKHADENVEAGRKFVEAYVAFTHYVERIHMDAAAHGAHHEEPQKLETEKQHHQ
jgi:hypothetical protein